MAAIGTDTYRPKTPSPVIGAPYTGTTDYSVNPAPQPGAGPFGKVPGPIGIPPNIYEQLSTVSPELTALTPTAAGYVGKELGGVLTDPEKKALQDQAAAWSYGAGVPMTSPFGIGANKWDTSRLLATMNREKQGLADYQSLLGNIGKTLTSPELATEIAARNAEMAAAPDPEQAFKAMMDAWMQKFNLTQGAARQNMLDYFALAKEASTPIGGYTGGSPRKKLVGSPMIVGGGGSSGPSGNPFYDTPSGQAQGANPGEFTGRTEADALSDWQKLKQTWWDSKARQSSPFDFNRNFNYFGGSPGQVFNADTGSYADQLIRGTVPGGGYTYMGPSGGELTDFEAATGIPEADYYNMFGASPFEAATGVTEEDFSQMYPEFGAS